MFENNIRKNSIKTITWNSKVKLTKNYKTNSYKYHFASHGSLSSRGFDARNLWVLSTAEATSILIIVIEASSKGRFGPPSNYKTFRCESKLVINLDIATPSVWLQFMILIFKLDQREAAVIPKRGTIKKVVIYSVCVIFAYKVKWALSFKKPGNETVKA